MQYHGSCHCGSVSLQVNIDKPLHQLHPRVCDCDYCTAHPAPLLSDPLMQVSISQPLSQLQKDHNGDGLAGFYRCRHCHDLIVIACHLQGTLRGVVNASLLADSAAFADAISVSPKTLTAREKTQRWQQLWGTVVASAPGHG
ncbi:hypothetical protein [Gallaecimonas sp. GXIMD1310]|uniref:hypothetical protein n=1 Tax=Gallaecimonas sp. GXIMD1310 TaxID=3131926 RepID=UPI0032430952